MSVNDYLKYMTETFLTHFEQPKADRIKLKLERREAKLPVHFQLFGLLPVSLKMFFRRS